MQQTRLAPEPKLVETKIGRERMVDALRRLYQVVEITDPPRIEDDLRGATCRNVHDDRREEIAGGST